MTPQLLTHLHILGGRGLEVLLALQPTATPGGGSSPAGGHGPVGGGGGGGGGLGGLGPIPMMLLMFGFLYFFMIRPMNQQKKDQESLQKGLRKGDKVVTQSGMIGTVQEVGEKEIVVEVADKVRVRFLRSAVERKYEPVAAGDAKTDSSADKGA